MDYPAFETIRTEVKENVLVITINMPEKSNALHKLAFRELRDVFELADKDDGIRAVMLTGEGKHFCAGGDIKAFKTRIEAGMFIDEEGAQTECVMAMNVKRCSKPTVAVVNGVAAGAGAALALACDFRIVSEKTKLIFAFINMALPGDTMCLYLLAKAVGIAKAQELMMLGEPIRSDAAKATGLAYKVTADDALLEEGFAFAKRLANGPSMAYSYQKREIIKTFYTDMEDVSELEIEGMAACSRGEDFSEAVYSFLEKRKPVFKGR